MAHLNPNLERVMRLILDEGIDAAEDYVAVNLTAAVDRARFAYERAQLEEAAARNIITLARPGADEPQVAKVERVRVHALPKTMAGLAENEKRTSILEAALKASPTVGDVIKTEDVLRELAVVGAALPGKRPGTSIGNVLYNDSRWERVAEGVFRRAT